MELTLRPETPADFRACEALTRAAFWDVYQPGCMEHHFLHQLRQSPAYLPSLARLAFDGDTLAGAIYYARSQVVCPDGSAVDTVTFGPLGVLPEYQGKGVGGALIRDTLARAADEGHAAAVILGDPRYYGRFGFHGCERFDLKLENGMYLPGLMALELRRGALAGGGRFHEGFRYDPEGLEAFDGDFPVREKTVRPSQAVFQVMCDLGYEVSGDGSL